MNGLSLFVWLVLAQAPTLQVTNLAGDQHEGTLESFAADAVVIKTNAGSISTPAEELLVIQSKAATPKTNTVPAVEVRLIDETRLLVKSFKSSGIVATLMHAQFGEIQIPSEKVASVRFAPDDPKIDAEWIQMIGRTSKKDVLAIRKGDVLDHLDGVIGTLNEATMQFQLDGSDIAVKREKIFGIIYSRRESTAKKAVARLELADGDRLAIKQIEWGDSAWKALTVSGITFDIPVEQFQKLDFSSGKVTYLSDLEPRSVKYTDRFDIQLSFPVNEYRRDKGYDGGPMMLNHKSYSKGLAIHARTAIKYRLGGDYRRFQAVMGIGDEYPEGTVNIVVNGDNKLLFKSTVSAVSRSPKGRAIRNPTQNLDIDVAGVVEFEILVDFGNDPKHVGELLYLANAKAIK